MQAAAAVNPSQIHHYFKDKKSLVKAVIAFQTTQVVQRSVRSSPGYSRLDSMEALRAWRGLCGQSGALAGLCGGCPIGSLGSELAESDPEARREVAAGFTLWEMSVVDGLRTVHDRGELRSDADPERLELALLTTLQGGLVLTQIRRGTAALEAGMDATLDHLETQQILAYSD